MTRSDRILAYEKYRAGGLTKHETDKLVKGMFDTLTNLDTAIDAIEAGGLVPKISLILRGIANGEIKNETSN